MSLLIKDKKDSNILIIGPYSDDIHLKNRIEGFTESMILRNPSAKLREINNSFGNNKDIKIVEILKNMDNLPDGIFVANSMVYSIAGDLNNKGGLFRSIPLIGYDIIPKGLDLITNGTIDFIITQQPNEQGYRGIKTLYDNLILKKQIDPQIIIPMNIITKENLSTF